MRKFNLEEAKAGKAVCTRDGRDVRILCFDAKGSDPIVAIFKENNGDEEVILRYKNNGKYHPMLSHSNEDLMMKSKKEKRWMYLNYKEVRSGKVVAATSLYTYRPVIEEWQKSIAQIVEFEVEV